MVLSEFLSDFLKKNDYVCEEILQYNHRKETYVLKIRYHNNFYLLKAYDKNKAPKDIKDKFVVEKEFYEKNKDIDSIPKLISFYENILILEYFSSMSLRDYLIENNNKKYLLENLVKSIENFDKKVYRKKDNIINYDNIFRYVSSLCNSHPFQAKDIKVSFIDRQLNRIINKLLIVKVKKIINLFDSKNLTNGFSHNDFHYNNILVTSDNRIKFIDFENIKYEGFFEFDILAFIVIMAVYVKKKDEQEILDKYLEKLFQKNKILKNIFYIYNIAISINKKFYIRSNNKYLNNVQKIILILKLILRK